VALKPYRIRLVALRDLNDLAKMRRDMTETEPELFLRHVALSPLKLDIRQQRLKARWDDPGTNALATAGTTNRQPDTPTSAAQPLGSGVRHAMRKTG
jgi:hypothetical protein